MDFCHLIVTCLFSMRRLPFDNQKVKGNYAIFCEKSPLTVRFMYEQGTFTNKVSIHNRLDLINSSIS